MHCIEMATVISDTMVGMTDMPIIQAHGSHPAGTGCTAVKKSVRAAKTISPNSSE